MYLTKEMAVFRNKACWMVNKKRKRAGWRGAFNFHDWIRLQAAGPTLDANAHDNLAENKRSK
jgi:hypothetical protein